MGKPDFCPACGAKSKIVGKTTMSFVRDEVGVDRIEEILDQPIRDYNGEVKYNYSGFLSVSQVANSLNYSSQAIRKAIKENRLDAYKIGKQWCIKCEDADKFINQSQH